jgi:TolB-like protein/DNA-binding winged helix-turn-helix (wHTH) protein/Flp pilus assembly protein TadD
MIYAFGDCELDTCLYTLRRAGQSIRLRPKVFRVCVYLVEHRDRVVSREELCAQVWPGQFISQATLEGVIRELRQAVGDSGQTQEIIQTLHGHGYRFVAAVAERSPKRTGDPVQPAPALTAVAAPATGQADLVVNVEPSAAQPAHGSAPEQRAETLRCAVCQAVDGEAVSTVTAREGTPLLSRGWLSPRRIVRMGQALAVLTLLLLAGWVLWRQMRAAEGVRLDPARLAVLPFLNLSAEGDTSYFADGMTEELIAQLSQVRGLTVIARTSAMKYKGTRKDIATIGRELQVGTILEGSVRQVDGRVRISAQLIDVASQGHLWAREYDRELKDVFDIQRDIATRVAERLKIQLTAGEKRLIAEQRTEDLEAYTWYLRGRYFRNQLTEEGLRKAIGYFERAIDRDPDYALAYAAMADAYLLLPFAAATTRPLEVYPRAMAAVEQALRHGDAFAEVHTVAAGAKLWYAWDWAGAEAAFKRALALSPNDAAAHHRYAWYLITAGRLDDALAVIHRAQELNPLSPWVNKNVGLLYYFARQYDRAIAQFRATLQLAPHFRSAISGLVYAYLQTGLYEEALAACQQMLERWGRNPQILWDFGYAAAVSGRRDQARQVLTELREQAQHAYVKPLALAWIAIGLGEKEPALAWLEHAYAERDPYLTLLNVEPVYDSLRAEPRFTALVKKVGLGH